MTGLAPSLVIAQRRQGGARSAWRKSKAGMTGLAPSLVIAQRRQGGARSAWRNVDWRS